MGAECLTEGIRTCALLVLTTVAITDHRCYLCPAPSAARRQTRTTHWSTAIGAAGQQPLGAAAMRRGATPRGTTAGSAHSTPYGARCTAG